MGSHINGGGLGFRFGGWGVGKRRPAARNAGATAGLRECQLSGMETVNNASTSDNTWYVLHSKTIMTDYQLFAHFAGYYKIGAHCWHS